MRAALSGDGNGDVSVDTCLCCTCSYCLGCVSVFVLMRAMVKIFPCEGDIGWQHLCSRRTREQQLVYRVNASA